MSGRWKKRAWNLGWGLGQVVLNLAFILFASLDSHGLCFRWLFLPMAMAGFGIVGFCLSRIMDYNSSENSASIVKSVPAGTAAPPQFRQ